MKLGAAWFYAGIFIYVLGTIFLIMAILAFASTPADEPVIKGVYSVSRHPMNFGMFSILIGIGVACLSWIYMLLDMVFLILMHFWLPSEARWCLKKYGDAYREYMDRTPRWIGIPKRGKSD